MALANACLNSRCIGSCPSPDFPTKALGFDVFSSSL
jgi:hypothetical protein